MTRLKDTPGGMPLTQSNRVKLSILMAVTAGLAVLVLLCLFGSSEPIVNDYPKLKATSLFSARSAHYAHGAEVETVVRYFRWAALVIGLGVGFAFYSASDPKKRKRVVNRGQIADSDSLARKLKNIR